MGLGVARKGNGQKLHIVQKDSFTVEYMRYASDIEGNPPEFDTGTPSEPNSSGDCHCVLHDGDTEVFSGAIHQSQTAPLWEAERVEIVNEDVPEMEAFAKGGIVNKDWE